jgi:hypothetical protein
MSVKLAGGESGEMRRERRQWKERREEKGRTSTNDRTMGAVEKSRRTEQSAFRRRRGKRTEKEERNALSVSRMMRLNVHQAHIVQRLPVRLKVLSNSISNRHVLVLPAPVSRRVPRLRNATVREGRGWRCGGTDMRRREATASRVPSSVVAIAEVRIGAVRIRVLEVTACSGSFDSRIPVFVVGKRVRRRRREAVVLVLVLAVVNDRSFLAAAPRRMRTTLSFLHPAMEALVIGVTGRGTVGGIVDALSSVRVAHRFVFA